MSGLSIDVDKRTEKMGVAALDCRADGHAFPRLRECRIPRPTLRDRSLQVERDCTSCGVTQVLTLELPSFQVTARRYRGYGDDYLVEKGSGRMLRADARAAMYARTFM
jgi:hypothetical protein